MTLISVRLPRLRYFAAAGVLVGLVMVQACSEQLKPESSCNFVQNGQYQRVSWSSKTITLQVDPSVPSKYLSAIETSVEIWNGKLANTQIRLQKTGLSGAAGSAKKDGVSKIYWRNTWDANKPNEQARTTVYWSGDHIYEADLQVNAKNFTYFTSAETPSMDQVHLESLIVHELGHVLGLAHTNASGSVMKPNLLSGYKRDEPGQTDLSSLKCEYQLSNSATVAASDVH